MLFLFEIDGRRYNIEVDNPLDISIPLNFNAAQPNAFGVEKASAAACESESLIGDTRRGGSCNFEQIKIIPHCNGTHTECVGHITHERISIHDCLKKAFFTAVLISVEPEKLASTGESYASRVDSADKMITRQTLERKLNLLTQQALELSAIKPQALIVRTLPNLDDKLSKTYLADIPPYFTNEAMEFIVQQGFEHLLVDLPSVDRTLDEGRLSNHRIFWQIEKGSFAAGRSARLHSTITELTFVPESVPDGLYILNLQIASFVADASPSRPLLFPISKNPRK